MSPNAPEPPANDHRCPCAICDAEQILPPGHKHEALDNFLRNTERLIDQHGVAIQQISNEQRSDAFAYTVGLFLAGHPEFVMFGALPEVSIVLLNHLATSVLDYNMTFTAGDTVHRLLKNLPTVLVDVDDSAEHLGMAMRIRDRRSNQRMPVRALQVALPDRCGRMPWHRAYSWLPVPLLGTPPMRGAVRHLPIID